MHKYAAHIQFLLTKASDDMATILSNGIKIVDLRSTHGVMEITRQDTRFMEMYYDSDNNCFNIKSIQPIVNVADYFIAEMEIRRLEKAVEEAKSIL